MKNNFDLIKESVKSFHRDISDKKQLAYDNMIDMEIDDLREEKLRGKAEEDTDEEVEGLNNVGWGMKGEL